MKRALLIYSFGGPESMDQVEPFLHRVTAGKRIAPERLAEVLEHYRFFNGVSPLNAAVRNLCLRLESRGVLTYHANRYGEPFLETVFRQMADDGVEHVTIFQPTPFAGAGPDRTLERCLAAFPNGTVSVTKPYFRHPLFLKAQKEMIRGMNRHDAAVFSVHSLPLAAAKSYEKDVTETFRQISDSLNLPSRLAWQSASQTGTPWLEPSVETVLSQLAAEGARQVLLVPLGFSLDNMEVVYDLDVAAVSHARAVGLEITRVPTIGSTGTFLEMVLSEIY